MINSAKLFDSSALRGKRRIKQIWPVNFDDALIDGSDPGVITLPRRDQ
jgi:hypothetical protein